MDEAPGYRLTLANEHTFLAWGRTALAPMATGVAVARFVPGVTLIRHALGILPIALGGLLSAGSCGHWERLQAERTAMAWQRTALGLGGVSALLLHSAGANVVPPRPASQARSRQ